MRILFITPLYLFPPYWGGGVRTYNLIKNLGLKHKIYLISPFYRQFEDKKINQHRIELKKLDVEIFTPRPLIKIEHPFTKHINPEVILKGMEIILTRNIDMIICDYPWSGINLLILNFFFRKPYIFHEHNIEFTIKDEIRARYSRLMKLLELILCKCANKIVTVSRRDKNILIREFGTNKRKITVVENGFDENTFYPDLKNVLKIRKKYNLKDYKIVLLVGKLDYPPNKEAAYNLRWNVLPNVLKKVSNVKFLVVGKRNKFKIKHKAMIFTGLVDNIKDYINAADVVVVPLLSGGGTRIKILEAIACGKTVVSTSKGAEGLINELTKPFLKISDNWETFSNYIVETLQNKKSRKVQVPKSFIKKYSWQNICRKFDKILRGLHED